MKEYLKPEMYISTFMSENVITSSGGEATVDVYESWKEANPSAVVGKKSIKSFKEFTSIIAY